MKPRAAQCALPRCGTVERVIVFPFAKPLLTDAAYTHGWRFFWAVSSSCHTRER